MSTLIKLMVLLLMMNIFIYLGMNFAITAEGVDLQGNNTFFLEGDLVRTLMSGSLQNSIQSSKENFTDYGINLTSSFTDFPEATGGEEFGTNIISFLDIPRIALAFIKTLFNIAVSPIALFTTFRLPPVLLALIGIPYLIIFVISAMAFLRGVSD